MSDTESLESTLETPAMSVTPAINPVLDLLRRAVRLPFEPLTWSSVLYVWMTFPLGIFYFVFLMVGFSAGLPLMIVWVGIPVLMLTFAGIWGFSSFERELARILLRADVPPMKRDAPPAPRLVERAAEFFANPVVWKGALFLAVKFPLGIFTFVTLTTSAAFTFAFLLAPWSYDTLGLTIDFGYRSWHVDSFGESLLAVLIGLACGWFFLALSRGLGWAWAHLAQLMLGAEQYRPSAAPVAPAPPADALPA